MEQMPYNLCSFMHGFLLIDKPEGITSFYCVKILRRLSGVRRIGFLGTLDPLATGLMIFALGEATKLISYLEGADKVYDVSIRLGAISDTYDARGGIEKMDHAQKPSRTVIAKLIEDEFIGPREQLPPAYSAIHVNGQRAYDLARKGQKVILKKRPVHFFEIKIRSYVWPVLKLNVHCGSGTYIRSLAHDLGQRLGCGGYVEKLRRVKIALHKIKDAISLDDLDVLELRKRLVLPQVFLDGWRQTELTESEYGILGNGGSIEKAETGADEIAAGGRMPILALYRGKCVGVLEVHRGKLKFARKFNIV
jgi:tRNA pseudouridine55 synthase